MDKFYEAYSKDVREEICREDVSRETLNMIKGSLEYALITSERLGVSKYLAQKVWEESIKSSFTFEGNPPSQDHIDE